MYKRQVSYWKVCDIEMDAYNNYCSVVLRGWINKDARDNRKQHIMEFRYLFTKEMFDFDYDQNIMTQIYSKIKSYLQNINDPELYEGFVDFSDAKDC